MGRTPPDQGPKLLVVAVLLLLQAALLHAELCSLDGRAGATLLLPYFEVDLGDANGVTTFFTVHNTSSEPVLVRVVLWTDAAFPTQGFELSLTGYDLQAVNLRDVFDGRLPDPEGSSLTPCSGGAPPVAGFLQLAHTGRATPRLEGLCAGLDHDDDVARGYVTMDVVGGCTDLMPSDEGYFGADGAATADNVLWGDFLYFDPSADRAEGDLLVSLEAEGGAFGPGELTFYGRYVGYSGIDGREPLPTLWSNRYLGGGALGITSRSIVWRDTGALPEAFDCPSGPDWYPLLFEEVISFDEQENAVFLTTDVAFLVEPVPPFPAAAQTGIGFRAFSFGWELLDLNPSPSERRQSYVMEVVEATSGASYMRAATPLDDGCSVAGCAFGDTETAIVCLVRDAASESTGLAPGEPIAVHVFPRGCFSSSCTVVYRAACQVKESAGGLEAEASFCLRSLGGDDQGCTDDCGGGGFAQCVAEGLPAGDYTLRLEDLEVPFSVPMDLPPEGICSNTVRP